MSSVVKRAMGAERSTRRAGRLTTLALLLGVGACNSVLGIEDLHEGPRPGSAGDTTGATGATDGTGGTKGNSGGSKGNNGGSSTAGSANAGAGNEPTGGKSGTAGSAATGGMNDAGAGGEANLGDTTVRGRLIDFWGHKLADIPVQIGDTLVTTDENGAFTIENVPATYDVSMAFDLDLDANANSFGWVFEGLTRRDPTLQVIRGLSWRYGQIHAAPTKVTVGTNQEVRMTLGGPDGNYYLGDIGMGGVQQEVTWEGGATSQPTAHALYLQVDGDSSLPTNYFKYNSSLIALAETGTTQISLDMSKSTIVTGNLQGTATSGGGSGRDNLVFLRFTTGGSIRLLDDSPAPNTFSYLVPTIPTSTISVAATEGDIDGGPYAVAHAEGLSVTSKPALKIPTPAKLVSPSINSTGISSNTKFTFTSPASNPGPFVVRFWNSDPTSLRYQTLWVVTAQKQVTIPEVIGGGFMLEAGKKHLWSVETDGSFASVDAMAGPKGFLDAYGTEEEPDGPNLADGTYTESELHEFTTAPPAP